jgi:hypothetical protein
MGVRIFCPTSNCMRAIRAAAGRATTLVVDVTNQNDKTWFDMAGNFHSDAIHVVERLTPADANTINYEATIDDPKTFSRPWTIALVTPG